MSEARENGATPRIWRWFDRMDRVVKYLGWAGIALAATCIAAVFVLLIAAAVSRPWSGAIFGIAYEVGGLLMWPIAFLPLAAVWRVKGHVRFDLFLRMTRGRRHHALELAGSLVTGAVAAILLWQASVAFLGHYEQGTATFGFRWPVWPMFAAVVAGTVLLALELVFSVLRDLRELMHPTGIEDETYGMFADGV